jgi:hypothetical protein
MALIGEPFRFTSNCCELRRAEFYGYETPVRTKAYRLCGYNEDGQLIGPAMPIQAANDAEAIAIAEAMRGSLAAELLDTEGLRIVAHLHGVGRSGPPAD